MAKAKTKRQSQECTRCRESKPDVKMRPDPYEQDLNGVIKRRRICDSCSQELADEL